MWTNNLYSLTCGAGDARGVRVFFTGSGVEVFRAQICFNFQKYDRIAVGVPVLRGCLAWVLHRLSR